ncbi:MAG: hypothetical protein CL946_06200 [Ectothiorhodospiraceae bacterium]|nr:hypothetical protein [Ectothiorhodospiraceae bacterium]
MLTGLQHAHSGLRWLVLLAGIAAIVVLILITVQKRDFKKADNIVLKVFTGLYDLQVLLGIIYLIVWISMGIGLVHYHYEHVLTMLVAAVLFHYPAVWKKREPAVRAPKTLLMYAIGFALVIFGIFRLPTGWPN